MWLGELIVAVDLERKATKQTNIISERAFSQRLLCEEKSKSLLFPISLGTLVANNKLH